MGFALAATLVLGEACSKSPTAPTPPPPPPPPPVGAAPTVTCVEGLARATVNAAGLSIHYDPSPVTVAGGEGSVSVSCDPVSGHTFPIGTTPVSCTATDSLNRTASCSFNVTVSRIPQIQRTSFLAFGDSITQGEVTVPVGGSLFGAEGRITRQVVVPAAAYPTVLARTLSGRYSAQASSISVANYGLAGEKAINARNRLITALNVVRPEVVLILHGHNDIARGENGAASGAASEVRMMSLEARSRGARVFIATPVPNRPGGGKAIPTEYLVDYAQRMRAAAAQEGAVLVDLYAAMLPDATRFIGVDGLHPTELGYARIADLFFQAIQNTLEVR
jgi:lysophospholipase L1-like esterase